METPRVAPISWQPPQGTPSWQLRALAQKSQQGYNPHPTLHRVREQEASRRKDLLILLLDVAGDLLENLQKQGPVRVTVQR